jgi:hypothetical protein
LHFVLPGKGGCGVIIYARQSLLGQAGDRRLEAGGQGMLYGARATGHEVRAAPNKANLGGPVGRDFKSQTEDPGVPAGAAYPAAPNKANFVCF